MINDLSCDLRVIYQEAENRRQARIGIYTYYNIYFSGNAAEIDEYDDAFEYDEYDINEDNFQDENSIQYEVTNLYQEELDGVDESIQYEVIQSINMFWIMYQEEYIPIFKTLYYDDIIERYLNMTVIDQKLSLAWFENCLEYLKSGYDQFLNDIWQFSSSSLSSDNNDVLIECCNVIDILLSKMNLREHYAELINNLNKLLQNKYIYKYIVVVYILIR